jgi:hypothetical protein
MRRHYHIEQEGDQYYFSPPVASFREAKHDAWEMVSMARATRIWRAWRVTWSDPSAGYHRWTGFTRPSGPAGGDYTDTITIIPCLSTHGPEEEDRE